MNSNKIINKETLEQVAKICGNQCAAYKALETSKQYENPVFITKSGMIIVIESAGND